MGSKSAIFGSLKSNREVVRLWNMPYRSDEEANRSRREQLESELADVKKRASEYAYLEWRAREIETELAELTKRQSELQKKRLPMLANAKVASPCNKDWDTMIGDDRVRFCKSCEKNVYNLSAMSAEEAEALLMEKEGKLCARYYLRTDGTILTSDCSIGVRRKWVRRAGTAAVALGTAAAATFALRPKAVTCEAPQIMGSVAVEPATPPSADVTDKGPYEMGAVSPHIDPVKQPESTPHMPKHGKAGAKDDPSVHPKMGMMVILPRGKDG